MEVIKLDGSIEKQIVTGMIIDDVVLGSISSKWDKEEGLFSVKWANVVAGWCIRYYDKYGKAPDHNIQNIFETWAAKNKNPETIELIESFLVGLSKKSKKIKKNFNAQLILDTAKEYFNKVQAERFLKQAENVLETEGTTKFFNTLQEIKQIEIGVGSTHSVFSDESVARKTFAENVREPLIKWPGEAGLFYGNIFERDSFVSFMGPEKSGKTFHLLDVAFRAVMQGRNVAFFEVGDLSVNQINMRFYTRVAKHPVKPGKVSIPTGLEIIQGMLKVPTQEKDYKVGLSFEKAWEASKHLLGGKKKDPLRVSVHPNNSISVTGVKSILNDWKQKDKWVPDIIVIDYADILAPINGGEESRHQINSTWKGLRALSQEYHACVVTATQTNAASYDTESLTRGNFSEDKRKNAHITAMIGINQSAHEKPLGLQRMNIIQLREDYFSPDEELLIAGCFALANPMIRSLKTTKDVLASIRKKENKSKASMDNEK